MKLIYQVISYFTLDEDTLDEEIEKDSFMFVTLPRHSAAPYVIVLLSLSHFVQCNFNYKELMKKTSTKIFVRLLLNFIIIKFLIRT